MKVNIEQLKEIVEQACMEIEDSRQVLKNKPDEAEVVKLKDTVRELLKLRELYWKLHSDNRITEYALEVAAIDCYHRMSEEQQAQIPKHYAKPIWYELMYQWKEKAINIIESEEIG